MFTWNRRRLQKLCGSKEDALEWSRKNGLLFDTKMCEVHETEMKYYNDRGFGRFRCNKGACRNKILTAAKGTWFEGSNLGPHTILSITYSYAVNDSYEQCRRETVELKENGDLNNVVISQVSTPLTFKW